jgi:hypothetical protein
MSIPAPAAERLSTVSRQLRTNSLLHEVHAQAEKSRSQGASERDSAKLSFSAAKQVVLRRLLESIDACDLAAAEENLQLAMSFAARIKGIEQAKQAV